MQLEVLDGEGQTKTVIVAGVEAPIINDDTNNAIVETGVSQALLAANPDRSGYALQNQGDGADHDATMWVNVLGEDAVAAAGSGSYMVAAGEIFPPQGFPLTVAAISITGTAGDKFTVMEW